MIKGRYIMMWAIVIVAIAAIATSYHVNKTREYKETIERQEYEIHRLEKELNSLQEIFMYKEKAE